MKIVILDSYVANPGDLGWEGLRSLGELTLYDRTPYDTASVVQRIADNEAVIVNKTPVTAEVLAACPSIQYIGILATGYNIVDIEAARQRGIPVCNVPAYSTDSVAQMVFAHILGICMHVSEHSAEVHQGKWSSCADFAFWSYPLIELAGKTLGIIGYGSIGQSVAKIAKAFGMKVLGYKRSGFTGDPYAKYASLDEIYAESDIISLHCPLTAETTGMVNRTSIAKMKDGVILINTARGPLIVDADLREALDSGKVYHAGIDVATVEPMPADNPLLGAGNCYITPHIAWAPLESRKRLLSITEKNLDAFIKGSPIHVVNP